MTVSDLLRAGGNLEAAAFGGKAELARYEVTSDGSRQTELINIDLASVTRGDPRADVPLRAFDYLLIKETPNWTDQESITLVGEVQFPGTYPIRRGETLNQVLQRAGGLTPLAFAKGSAFTRKELKEASRSSSISERPLQTDVFLSLQAAAANQAGASQALTAAVFADAAPSGKGRGALSSICRAWLRAVRAGERHRARDGPGRARPKQEVTVIGEVQSTLALLQRGFLPRGLRGAQRRHYRKADKNKIYVVRADGSVVADQSSMFRRSNRTAMQPGDTIVVPLDTERMPRLPFWLAVTQIVYNLAISVSAINSF